MPAPRDLGRGRTNREPAMLVPINGWPRKSIAFLRERPILVLHYGGFDRRRKDNTRADEVIVGDKRQKQRLGRNRPECEALDDEIGKHASVADQLGSTVLTET